MFFQDLVNRKRKCFSTKFFYPGLSLIGLTVCRCFKKVEGSIFKLCFDRYFHIEEKAGSLTACFVVLTHQYRKENTVCMTRLQKLMTISCKVE